MNKRHLKEIKALHEVYNNLYVDTEDMPDFSEVKSGFDSIKDKIQILCDDIMPIEEQK